MRNMATLALAKEASHCCLPAGALTPVQGLAALRAALASSLHGSQVAASPFRWPRVKEWLQQVTYHG